MKMKLYTRNTFAVVKAVLMLCAVAIIIAWITEHITHKANFIIRLVSPIAHKDHWLVASIIVLILGSIFFRNRSSHAYNKSW